MSAGIQLQMKPFSFQQAESTIRKIVAKAGHLKIPFHASGNFLIARTHTHFVHERSSEGEAWAALTTAYVAWPKKEGRRNGRAHPILHVHGYLEASINYKAGDASLAVGTNRKFPGGSESAAAIQQLGGTGRDAKIPARPFQVMVGSDEDRIGDFLMEYLAKL
jgi:phage gpG-like protein